MTPTRVITFLGITLDTVFVKPRLPEYKLEKAKTLLEEFQRKQKVTLRELQSLIGILNFACKVIVPGRAFLSFSVTSKLLARPKSWPYSVRWF